MTHGIRRILCCLGLRGDCDPVLDRAVGLSLATGAELHVLHAVKSLSNDVVNTLKVNIRDREVLGGLMQQRLDQAGADLDRCIETFWQQHPELCEAYGDRQLSRSVLEGYPASVIAHFAKRTGSDMIVLAANKRTFTATYAGKVTKGVIKRARVPVVVVPASRE
ncbi:universal stress protein [Halomonas organivorans]|uniref:Nucleotide-binding universal stress UspA family protein n=1 Tax=Halomonas organivorans TaxID=257772 RepID=A0A7W5BY51_9GAMM|nr:universal stress protein [Halomonas organivorans]MBB3141310.1 nucleotide-binding universal stress UspA family protein [Halomonas organivorans]